jgi:Family of unknown function (DUF5677)/SEC-C motif
MDRGVDAWLPDPRPRPSRPPVASLSPGGEHLPRPRVHAPRLPSPSPDWSWGGEVILSIRRGLHLDLMTDDPADGIKERFRGKINGCERLLVYAESLLGDWPGRAVESVPDGLILALFARSFDTAAAAIRLAADGYGAQASMLNRSLFEDMIDVHWVATEEEAAERCYADHLQHGRMLLADAVAKYPEFYAEIDLPQFDVDERRTLDREYGRFGHKSWTKVNLHDRVSFVEHHWSDEIGRGTLHFFHDIAHRENNQTLHVSSATLGKSLEFSDGEVGLTVGPREDMVDRALFGSFWILDSTIGLLLDRFGIELDEKTRAEIFSPRDFISLSDEQTRDVGRNDPCPCGSGIKFKRCHGF